MWSKFVQWAYKTITPDPGLMKYEKWLKVCDLGQGVTYWFIMWPRELTSELDSDIWSQSPHCKSNNIFIGLKIHNIGIQKNQKRAD